MGNPTSRTKARASSRRSMSRCRATGTAAAAWPRAAGLKTDERGFILTNDYLQSVSHSNVFAAGDCATMVNHPRPKSGVYAVRAGPPLAANLRRALDSEIPGPTRVPSAVPSLAPSLVSSLVPYKPQHNSLYLISLGNKSAIGSWNGLSWEGDWVWRWKNRIDRRFIAKYVNKTPPNAANAAKT